MGHTKPDLRGITTLNAQLQVRCDRRAEYAQKEEEALSNMGGIAIFENR